MVSVRTPNPPAALLTAVHCVGRSAWDVSGVALVLAFCPDLQSRAGSCCVAMTTEECPAPLGVSQLGAGLCEDYGPSQGDDIIEEAGPCDDTTSDLSTLVVPFPELAPVVFFCLKQTTCPRNLCIRMVSNPYPLSTP
ncbi:hypothetical protein P4O66_007389 [Electrophorus voltai]|uniref:Uncharacterized protein n=1 Tax=Electrophorus voltai TaxID=2609070 RepID=A0AAD9DZX4_9TELE|nr:voltage-dependent T-type calcium channel subunit alpha-1G-like [Electrophorus electricus]KAK1799129.1 hypothetical protein P4O66_007389 [Electrophorus voltai]